MKRVEALTDAFARMYGWHDPKSVAYTLRNPLLLKAFTPKHTHNENGYRIFSSFPSGYDNGILDLKIKCSGKSRAKLTPDNTLTDLVLCYGNPAGAADYIVNFLRQALQDLTITKNVPLSWFLADLEN